MSERFHTCRSTSTGSCDRSRIGRTVCPLALPPAGASVLKTSSYRALSSGNTLHATAGGGAAPYGLLPTCSEEPCGGGGGCCCCCGGGGGAYAICCGGGVVDRTCASTWVSALPTAELECETVPSCGNCAISFGISCARTCSIAAIAFVSSFGNLVRSCPSMTALNLATSGKSPTGRECARCTLRKCSSMLASSFACAFCAPK
mmetsp:Transcript_11144/g.32757  ORF Transcript_11144/g.32757 Transcript_11144/m.32757 type:complete len:203 (-) Transcript_11144:1000-1608(-)